MGCVHSKHLKKHARVNGEWAYAPPAKKSFKGDSNASLTHHHAHIVDLTSSSYGLLKVDITKSIEQVKKENESSYKASKKLRGLESTESVRPPQTEVSSILDNLRSSVQRSKSCPPHRQEKLEIINVADMMKGLEDDMPAEAAESVLVSPGSSKMAVPNQHKVFDKAVSFHTIKELDAALHHQEAEHGWKVSKDPVRTDTKSTSTNLHCGLLKPGNFVYENAEPPGFKDECAPSMLLGNQSEHPKAVSCSEISYTQLASASKLLNEESIARRKVMVEDRSVFEHSSIRPNLEAASSPFKRFSTFNGKVKITLNVEYENNFLASILAMEDSSTPSGSSSKRALLDHSDTLSDPGSPFFDPELLASYEKDLENLRKEEWNYVEYPDELPNTNTTIGPIPPLPQESGDGTVRCEASKSIFSDPLEGFEERCPPGGEKLVVLYTTSLRGIRKTFEDCNRVREILQSFGLSIDERDVSMHLDFRNELGELVGRAMPVPRLFIKGRYIGGVEEVTKLNDDVELYKLVEGLPKQLNGGNCDGCGGVRFVPCLECCGSCKMVNESNEVMRCPDCNENGLIKCPICS